MFGRLIITPVSVRWVLIMIIGLCPLISYGKPEVELLWPDGAPGAIEFKIWERETYIFGRVRNVREPSLTIYLPPEDKASGTAVVICPGGGYKTLAIKKEGYKIAAWLNSLGVAGFVLKYRHHQHAHPIPLMDAQRAIRMVRSRSEEWNVDPDKVGIMGFSAGGHVASTLGTHFDTKTDGKSDPIDKIDCRPDFMILIYPVVSMLDHVTHKGSKINLLGENPKESIVEELSNELQVTKKTPPTFLVHAKDDKTVLPENTIYFYRALRKAAVPAEMHIYENGGHGFGLGIRGGLVASWPQRCMDWMRSLNLLKK